MPSTKQIDRGAPSKTDLARIEKRLRDKLDAGDRAAWDAGILFDRIAQTALWRLSGHDSLRAYADARFPEEGYRSLQRYRRVARAFTRRTVVKHGVSKLDLGLRYIAATPDDERPAELPRLDIAIPIGRGRKTRIVPFADASARDLERAVAHLTRASVRRLPRGARALTRAVQRALARTRLPKGTPRPTVDARTVEDETGKDIALLTLRDIPADHLPEVARSLTRAAR